MTPKRSKKLPVDGPIWIYGRHAVEAVLRNPRRHQHKLLATRNALNWLAERGKEIAIEPASPKLLDDTLPAGAVHQGLAVLVNPLPDLSVSDTVDSESGAPVIVLDQVTDPQNIGAIFRLAAAFGAQAIIAQDRRTPALGGALAKAAVGAVEMVPLICVVNISRTLNQLAELGFTTIGFDGEAETKLPSFQPSGPVALVLGAEGRGMRPLVKESCNQLLSIPMSEQIESLNVATAAAISLYQFTQIKP